MAGWVSNKKSIEFVYPCDLKMQVSVGIKSTLGKALIEGNGYSLGEIKNAE